MLTATYLHMNGKTYLACNFNYRHVTTQDRKLRGNLVHCTNSTVSDAVQDKVVATTYHYWEVICDLSNCGNSDD